MLNVQLRNYVYSPTFCSSTKASSQEAENTKSGKSDFSEPLKILLGRISDKVSKQIISEDITKDGITREVKLTTGGKDEPNRIKEYNVTIKLDASKKLKELEVKRSPYEYLSVKKVDSFYGAGYDQVKYDCKVTGEKHEGKMPLEDYEKKNPLIKQVADKFIEKCDIEDPVHKDYLSEQVDKFYNGIKDSKITADIKPAILSGKNIIRKGTITIGKDTYKIIEKLIKPIYMNLDQSELASDEFSDMKLESLTVYGPITTKQVPVNGSKKFEKLKTELGKQGFILLKENNIERYRYTNLDGNSFTAELQGADIKNHAAAKVADFFLDALNNHVEKTEEPQKEVTESNDKK